MITVNIPKTLNSFSAIYAPSRIKMPNGDDFKYRISVPAARIEFETCNIKYNNQRTGEPYETPFVNASSDKPPVIMIGNGGYRSMLAWQDLCDKAAQWRIPLDVLLIGRELNVVVDIWKPVRPAWMGSTKDAVALHAVQILGDLTKSQALNDRIDEIKGWFEQ